MNRATSKEFMSIWKKVPAIFAYVTFSLVDDVVTPFLQFYQPNGQAPLSTIGLGKGVYSDAGPQGSAQVATITRQGTGLFLISFQDAFQNLLYADGAWAVPDNSGAFVAPGARYITIDPADTSMAYKSGAGSLSVNNGALVTLFTSKLGATLSDPTAAFTGTLGGLNGVTAEVSGGSGSVAGAVVTLTGGTSGVAGGYAAGALVGSLVSDGVVTGVVTANTAITAVAGAISNTGATITTAPPMTSGATTSINVIQQSLVPAGTIAVSGGSVALAEVAADPNVGDILELIFLFNDSTAI